MDQKPKRPRGRPPVENPMNFAVTIHVSQTMLDQLPKNSKGNPDQDELRRRILNAKE